MSLPTTTEGSPRDKELNRRSGSTGTLEKPHVVKKNNFTDSGRNEPQLFVLPQKNIPQA
jgi:hypothetical protein